VNNIENSPEEPHCGSKESVWRETELHVDSTIPHSAIDKQVMSRTIEQIVESREQEEGMGARVRRSIGSAKLRNLDPFLLLDEFKVKKPAGFPDHPHRGFETVTYMLDGSFRHEDFCGHKGIINPGDLQVH